jgi:hypothetical protein
MAQQILRFPASRQANLRYIAEMRSVYGSMIELPDPDYALANDPYIYNKVMRDPVIASAIFQRLHSVAGNDWHIEASSDEEADKKAAEIVEDLLGHISKFVQARYELASGIIRGRSYAYIRGQRRRMKIAGTMAEWWVPHILKDIDKRRLHYKPSREPTKAGGFDVSQVLEYWSMRKNDWVEMTKEKRRALVVLTYQDREERLGYGEGLIVPIYHYFYAKGRIWQSSMEFLERYSQGIITAQVDPDRPGSVGKTNEEIVAEWHDVIDQMRARHALVYSKNDEMNIVEPSGSGANVGLDLLHYTDQCLTRLINGSIRPSGVDTETGARSQGEVEQETSDILISYDRELLDGALTEHLVRLVWEMNLPTLRGMGLGSAQMPKFATSQERREDPSEVATQVETLLRAGVHLSKSEVYERCGWRQPAKGEDILKAPEQPQAPGGAPGASPFGLAHFGDYDETKHKRDEGGKWATKEGTGEGAGNGGEEPLKTGQRKLPDYVEDRMEPAHPPQPFKSPVYHGSANGDLDSISADPPSRQYDNGTSQLGAFVATDRAESERYGEHLYTTDLHLEKPFEMSYSLFAYLQDPTKSADRKTLSSDEWHGRLNELREEGKAIRDKLSGEGYDGVIVRDSKGNIKEIASFADIPMRKAAK